MKKQTYFCASLCLFLAVVLASCNKEVSYNGDVTVTVDYQGHALSQAKVYYNKGVVINKGITPDRYNGMQTTDNNGVTVFNNLEPGSYYFYATGFSAVVNKAVQGDTDMMVHTRYRDRSVYHIVINTK